MKPLLLPRYVDHDTDSIFMPLFHFFLVLHLIPGCALGQNSYEQGTPLITNYTQEEIHNSQYWCAVQDYRGIMYFGVNSGIVEFDGSEYRLIETPLNSVIRTLCITPDSTIYAGGDNDFGYLAYSKTGETVFISLSDKLKKEDRHFTSVTKIFHMGNSTWFLTDDKGVFKLTNDSLSILPYDLFSRYGATAHNRLFIFSENEGIWMTDGNDFTYLPHTKMFTLPSVGKTELLPYRDNKLLLVTKDQGIYLYHLDRLLQQKKLPEDNVGRSIVQKFETEIEEYLIQNIVYPCVAIDSTRYAFGTLLGGIIIMNDKGELVRVINENRGLYDNIIYGLATDRNHNLWALTNNGISYIEIGSSITSFNKDNKVSKFLFQARKHQGTLYLAHDKGISYLPDYKLQIENDDHQFLPVKGIKGRVDTFCPYRNIILCEADSKLYAIYKEEAKVIAPITPLINITRSSKFDDHVFYCSSEGAGYIQIDYQEQGDKFPLVKIKAQKDFTGVAPALTIVEDPKGNILLSSRFNGIYHVKFQDDVANYVVTRYDTTHGLPDLDPYNFITYSNHVFVGSREGLLEAKPFPPESPCCDSIASFVPETYFKDRIKDETFIIYDGEMINEQSLWLRTSSGLGSISLEKNDKNFTWQPFQLHGIEPNSIYVDDSKNYWITSGGVLYRFDPLASSHHKDFQALIRKVTVGADSIVFNGAYVDDPQQKGYNRKTSMQQPARGIPRLEFSHNSIRFDCAASAFEAIGSNEFRYFMEGVDQKWSEWSAKTKKEYSYLPVGQYTFHVKARDPHGQESQEATFRFEILAPWYHSAWAYAAYLIIGLLLIAACVRLYYNYLIQSKRRLQNIIDERTLEIREKNIQLNKTINELKQLEEFKESMIHMIVHDLKNPLNTIIGYGREKQASRMNSFILHSGKTMLNMVDNILNVHKFEESRIRLKAETYDIKRVIAESVQEVSFLACERKITITDNTSSLTFVFDVELIKRVIVNLLTNAIKFSPDEDEIVIDSELVYENNRELFRISVRDHGAGIPAEMTERIFDKYVQVEARKLGIAHSTGLGLTFCKLVIEAHKGKIGVQSSSGEGSSFHFTLPVI
jgi:signal transduction histidine kinase/ligand-binding sensor domain-containing protein